jgi:hypothetical protein
VTRWCSGAGFSDARHHIYWSESAEYVGEPEDAIESDRIEWIPLNSVPETDYESRNEGRQHDDGFVDAARHIGGGDRYESLPFASAS